MKRFRLPRHRVDGWGTLVNMDKNPLRKRAVVMFLLAVSALASSQTKGPQAADSKTIPVVDGGVGPCSADFTVTDAAGAPVYAAKIKVHVAYGFMNVRKLDLEVGTNAEGKARFAGLPDRIKHGLYFYASEGDRAGEVFDDPANTCKAQFTIPLQKKASNPQ